MGDSFYFGNTMKDLQSPSVGNTSDSQQYWAKGDMQLWSEAGQTTGAGYNTFNVNSPETQALEPNINYPNLPQGPGTQLAPFPPLQSFNMAGPSAQNSNVTGTQMQSPFLSGPTSVGSAQDVRLPRQGFTAEQDNFLLKLRREGREYSHIAKEMHQRFGIVRSENCLVKRLGVIQHKYLEPLPAAVKNAMPDIMACIIGHMNKMPELAELAENEQDLLEQIIHELPRSIPKFVQNKVTSKRKTMLNTSPNRT